MARCAAIHITVATISLAVDVAGRRGMRIRLVFLRQGDKFENGSVRNCVKYVVSSLSELICASLFDTMVPDESGYLTPHMSSFSSVSFSSYASR